MTDPRSTASIPVAPEPDDDEFYVEPPSPKIWEGLPATRREARPTPVEPEARPLTGKAVHDAFIAVDHEEGGHSSTRWGAQPEDVRRRWDKLAARLNGRLAVEPDGLPLDVLRATRLFEAVRRVITDGMDSPGVRDELHRAFYSMRDGTDYPASTPSEAKP